MEENGLRRCPRCNGELRLVNVVARFGGRPEIHIYECSQYDQPRLRTINDGGGQNRPRR
jgi:hypothetical protein